MDRALRKALEASEEGRAYLAAKKAARASRSRRTAGKKAPGRAAKKAKRESRSAALHALRVQACARRPDGRCEFCETHQGTELHHLLSGGLRRHREALSTVAMVCGGCHQDYHRCDEQTMSLALDWAHRHGYWTTSAAVAKRLDKVREARRTPSVPVRIEVKEGA